MSSGVVWRFRRRGGSSDPIAPSIPHVHYSVVAVGKAREPYADDLAHYEKLLSRYARVDVIEVADDDALKRRIPERAWVCLLDSRGRSFSSEAFAGWLEERRMAGRDVAFVIGGAYGTSLENVDFKLSFGPA